MKDSNEEYNDYHGEPKPGMEYIYRLDMAWQNGVNGHIPIELNSIVTDVVAEYRDNDSCVINRYFFTLKSNDERYHCGYSWAFAENTEENESIANTLASLKAIIDKYQEIYNDKYKELVTLAKRP